MTSSRRSSDADVEALRKQNEELAARVTQLEAELARRGATEGASREERARRRAQLETEITDLEREAREERAQRVALLEEIDAELERIRRTQRSATEESRLDELQAQLRRLDGQQRETRAARAERLRQLNDEMPRTVAPPPWRSRRRAWDRFPDWAADDPWAGRPYRGAGRWPWELDIFSETSNLAMSGLLQFFDATADTLGAFTDEILTRNDLRGGITRSNMAAYLPADVYSGLKAAVNRAADRLEACQDTVTRDG
jgi:hypothetical protein